MRIGSQYVWLAKIAQQYPGIELGLEKPNGEFSGAITAITHFGKLVRKGNYYVLEKDGTQSAISLIFGNITLPLANTTETEMLENIRAWGYEDVMEHIWFCHTPITKKISNKEGKFPCGTCRPCQQKMECHMEFLLNSFAQRRYKIFRVLSKLTGERIARRIVRKF